MKKQLMIAALAAAGLAACGEDRAVQTSTPTGAVPVAPTQVAAQPAPTGQLVAQDEKTSESKFEAEGKGDTLKSQDEEKKDEGVKKAD